MDHLQNLLEHGVLKSPINRLEQDKEELLVAIDSKSSFRLWSQQKTQHSEKLLQLEKLQFFHVWIFYYLYSADHKFLKAILKQKFPFCSLFSKEIRRLIKPNKYKEVIR